MNLINRLKSAFAKPKPDNTHLGYRRVNLEKPKSGRVNISLKRANVSPVDLEMDNLRVAVAMAKSVENPNRITLYNIYEQILEDSHLFAQIRTAYNTVLQSEFRILNQSNSEQIDLKELFGKEWFHNFVINCIDSEFWGHSLMEFIFGDDGLVSHCDIIPRYHVSPEFGIIKINMYDVTGIPFRDLKLNILEIGEKYDLGILRIAAKEVIWKTFSRTDWSQACEKFGMPFLTIRAESPDPAELDEMENMAANFGTNGYVILNKQDEVDFKSVTGNGTLHEIYKESALFCDEQISKLINGQTGTQDQKSFVGAAQVHERILNDYTKTRLQKIQNIINNKLFPFLIENGYNLKGLKFVFEDIDGDLIREKLANQQNQQANNNPNADSMDMAWNDFRGFLNKKKSRK